jgi:hypothetical protein
MKPFRFSMQAFAATSAADWRSKVQRAQDLGYSAFHLADHYLGAGPALAAANHPVQNIAAVPAIAMAAEASKTIKVGCRVFCTSYRPAPVLVKEALTLDFLPAETLLEFSHALIGSVDSICQTLEKRREQYGFNYISVSDANAEAFAPVVARLQESEECHV